MRASNSWFRWPSILLGAMLWFAPGIEVGAAPFAKNFQFIQPDGSKLILWGKGDEFHADFETEAGYTVVFDPVQKAYFYAERSLDGKSLQSTGKLAHQAPPLGLVPHIRNDRDAVIAKARERQKQWDARMGVSARWSQLKAWSSGTSAATFDGGPQGAPPTTPTLGTKIGLCLLIDFSDDPATIPQSEIFNYCNGDNYTGFGNNGSVKQYYRDTSNGLLTYSNIVTLYVRMVRTKAYYNDVSQNCGLQGNLLIKDALAILKARPDYNTVILPTFNSLTVDSRGWVLACNVFFAGADSGVWMQGLWPHSWALNDGTYYTPVDLGNGKKISYYQITDVGDRLTLATFCHENGHLLCGFPDLYDYQYDSAGGAGYFCIMGFGINSFNPVQFCAYLKRAAGWATVTELTSDSNLTATLTSSAGAGFNHFYRYLKPGVSTEYFLVENRQRSGRDTFIPGSGIVIWHIDELGDRDNQSLIPNNQHANFEVTLVQADNQWHLQYNVNLGDNQDLYYLGNTAAAYANRFNDVSTPAAHWWDGTPSFLKLSNFSANGVVMTFNVGGRTPAIQVSGDLAFGEVRVGLSAQRTFTISNSGNATLTVTGISYPPGFTGNWNGTIAPENAQNITVTFAPTALANYGGPVTVNSDATGGSNVIQASGTGVPPPSVSVLVPDAEAGEPGTGLGGATFVFSRTGSTALPLTVHFTVGGNASSGVDYTAIGTTVNFEAGADTTSLVVSVLDDGTIEDDETVTVTLLADPDYIVATPTPASITIKDDDATVTLSATDTDAGELTTGLGAGTFTFTRSGYTLGPLTVDFTRGGSATYGQDYALVPPSLTFAEGAPTATLVVDVFDDTLDENNETVVLTLADGPGYLVGNPSSASITIQDATIITNAIPLITSKTLGVVRNNYNGWIGMRLRVGIAPVLVKELARIFLAGNSKNHELWLVDSVTKSVVASGVWTPSGGVPQEFKYIPITPVVLEANREYYLVSREESGGDGWCAISSTGGTRVTTTTAAEALSAAYSANGTTWGVTGVSGQTYGPLDLKYLPIGPAEVSVTASDAVAGEPGSGQGTGVFTFTRSGNTSGPLAVNVMIEGTAINGTDYASLNPTVNFAAGAATATLTITVIDDSLGEGDETILMTLTPGSGYLVGSPSAASVTLKDDDAGTTVSVTATDATAGEPGSSAGSGTFTFTRAGNTTGALTVNFTVEGTATSGLDYNPIGTTVSFAPGANTATRSVSVIDDNQVEGDETVTVTLAEGSGYVVVNPSTATVIIKDDDVDTFVTVAATDALAGEPVTGEGSGTFAFTRTGNTSGSLVVNLLVSGTAGSGIDYTAFPPAINFAPGATTVTQVVAVIDDNLVEDDESVVVIVAPGPGYAVGDVASATVTLKDDDALVTLVAMDSMAGEPATGEGTGVLNFTRTGFTAGPLKVNFTVSGTASSGADYTTLGTTVDFPAGVATATLAVSVLDDNVVESDETVVITLAAGTGYTIGSPSVATVTLKDDDATVTVAATDAIAGEPATGQDSATFTFTRTGYTSGPLAVNFTVTGTASSGTDYSVLGTTVNFNASATTAVKTVNVLDDDLVESDETVIVTLAAGTGYTIGNPSVASIIIKDDDLGTAVTVVATDAIAGEPATGDGTGAFTFTRSGNTSKALTVSFTLQGTAIHQTDFTDLGATVTFDPGASTVTKIVDVKDDQLVETDETVILNLVPSASYSVGNPSSATVVIKDDDGDATVTLSATDPTAGEPGAGEGPALFTFTRSGNISNTLTVSFTVTGSANNGADYNAMGTSVNFAIGSKTATQSVNPIDDHLVEGDETIVLTLAGGAGYVAGNPSSATVTLKDDDATVTVVATDTVAGEPGTGEGPGTFTFMRSGYTSGPLTVNFTVGGTAVNGTDFSTIGTSVSFLDGATTATQSVSVIQDNLIEDDETVELRLAEGPGYIIGTPSSAVVTIKDAPIAQTITLVTSKTLGSVRNNYTGWIGMRLRVGSMPMLVKELGRIFLTGNTKNHELWLVDATTKSVVASGVWTPADGVHQEFSYIPIEPVVLETNREYYLVSREETGGDGWCAISSSGGTRVTTTTAAEVVSAAYSANGTTWGVTGVTGQTYGPLDLKYVDANAPAVVTVTATDPIAGEPATGEGTGTFTFTRIGNTQGTLTVNFTVQGTANSGSDYASISSTVSFPAGATTVTQTVTVLDDGLVEGDETVLVTLADGTGYLSGNPSSATVTIKDDDIEATVTLAATDAVAGEPASGEGPGLFTFTRSGNTSSPLTVNINLSGTASNGADYTALGTTVNFTAGAVTTTLAVNIIDDTLVEGDENISVTLAAGPGYIVGNPSSATVLIKDDDAMVTVVASDPTAGEPATAEGTGTFTFTRTGNTTGTLVVNFSVVGTASSGTDYTALGTTISFPAGATTATKILSPIDDNLVEGDETVVLTLDQGAGYAVGSPASAIVVIKDDDATVSVTTTDAIAGEPATSEATGAFTFTRVGNTAIPLTVNFTLGGTASNGTDYSTLGTTITFVSGAATVIQIVEVIDDNLAEGDETIVLSLAAGTGYAIASPSTATIILKDDEVAVSVAATDAIAGESGTGEGTGTFTFSRAGNTSGPLTVNYSVEGAASNGTDYNTLGNTVNFLAGQTTAIQVVTVIEDTLVEGDETVRVTLTEGPGYTLGTPTSATVVIKDDDVEPTVTIAAIDASAGEPATGEGTGAFCITRSGNTSSSLTVNLSVEGTATSGIDYTALPTTVNFAPHATSVNLTVSPLEDDLFEGEETVTVRIAAGTGYSAGTPSSATVIIKDAALADLLSLVTSKNLGAVRNNYNGWVGMRLRVGSTPMQVHFLGRIFLTGNVNPHEMWLVDATTKTVIASATWMPTGGIHQEFQYIQVDPVVLETNREYYLVSREESGGDSWCGISTTGGTRVTTTSAAEVVSAAYSGNSTTWGVTGTSGQTYVPVDLKYQLVAAAPARDFAAVDPAPAPQEPGVTVPSSLTTVPVTKSVAGRRLKLVQWSPEGPDLNIQGAPGETLEIHSSTNLRDWKLMSTVVNLTGSVSIIDTEATQESPRFYRVVPRSLKE